MEHIDIVGLSSGVMPLWTLQFARSRAITDLVLSPGDIPYLYVFIYLLVFTAAASSGFIIRHRNPQAATNISRMKQVFAGITIAHCTFASIMGGSDLLPSIDAGGGASCFLWSVILAGIVIISFFTARDNGPKWRACFMFLLLKDNTIAYKVISSALSDVRRPLAFVGADFFALMTMIMGVAVLIIYGVIWYCRQRGLMPGDENIEGQINDIDDDDDADAVMATSFTGSQTRQGYTQVPREEIPPFADNAGRTALKTGVFGTPNLFMWI